MLPLFVAGFEDVITGWNGLTGDMFLGVLTDIKSLLPIAAPAVIGFIAFRKGWSWLKGQIKGA